MAAGKYHYPQPETRSHRFYSSDEDAARRKIEKQGQSNWLAWALTAAAILIGCWAGIQLSDMSLDSSQAFSLSAPLGWIETSR